MDNDLIAIWHSKQAKKGKALANKRKKIKSISVNLNLNSLTTNPTLALQLMAAKSNYH